MVVLLIGPSRAGKSTLAKRIIPFFPSSETFDLDELVERRRQREKAVGIQDAGWPQFWSRSLAELEDLNGRFQGPGSLAIVAVGAGSLQTDEGRGYFRAAPHVVAIVAPFEAILSRHPGRDPAELRTTEFSDAHMSLYSAVLRIHTGMMDEVSATEELVKLIHRMRNQFCSPRRS
ncbi:MAG: hypothetical protein HY645_14895 [Acidobacteria bacterium]|nr:hypothetical protein [Acidobacteriota bacterium]